MPKARKNERSRTHTIILNLVQNLKLNQTLKRLMKQVQGMVQGDKEGCDILNSSECPACKGGVTGMCPRNPALQDGAKGHNIK